MKLFVHDYAGHIGQLEVARALAARGHDVVFAYCDLFATPHGELSADALGERLSLLALSIGEPIDKTNYVKRQWQDIRYGAVLGDAIRRHRPEVVLSANTPLMPQWKAQRTCRSGSIRFIHWWTDVYSLAVVHGVGKKFGGAGKFIGLAYQRLESKLLRQSQAIIAIAPMFQEVARAWGVQAPISVIPVVAPVDRIRPIDKQNAWARKHHVAETTNVLYSGTLGNKHLPGHLYRLAKVLAVRTDVRVIVVAEGVGADALREQQDRGPLDNLILLPFQEFEDYEQVLAAGDIHVTILSASGAEYALPSKVMSQLCAGRVQVAVVPEHHKVAELIRTAEAGYVCPPAAFEEFESLVGHCLENPAESDRLGAQGRAYAEKNLAMDSLVGKYQAILDHVATS